MALPVIAAAMAIQGGAQLIGSIIGGIASRGQREAAERAANDAYNIIASLGLPPDESKALLLEKFKEAGVYTPQLEQDLAQLPDSAFESIKLDPRTKEAQFEALQKLQQSGRVGLGAQERAAMAEAQDQAAREAEGQRQQILQQMQARGLGGSGAELAMQIAGQQSAANRSSLDALRVGSMASQRALEAARQSGAMAGDIERQQYQQQSDLAQNRDAIKRFNVQNQIQSQRANVGMMNQAQLRNLENRQRMSDMNVGMSNQEALRQSNARRQYWTDQMARNQVLANAKMGQASNLRNEAAGTQQSWQNIGSGIGQIGSGMYASGSFSNKYSPQVEKDFRTQLQNESTQDSGGWDGTWNAAHGGMVPGEPIVPGDHPVNDIVDAKLSPDEIVIPKSITEAPNAPDRAAGYIQALLSLKNKGK